MAELEIRFEPGKSNITPDALSMLPSGNDIYERLANREHRLETDDSILEVLQADPSRTAAYIETSTKVSELKGQKATLEKRFKVYPRGC